MQTEIRTKQNMFEEVESFPTDNPNIVIHKTAFKNEAMFSDFAEAWSITHSPTGMAFITHLPSMEIAEAIAAWIGKQELMWDGTAEEITESASSNFREVISDLQKEKSKYVDVVISILEIIDYFSIQSFKK